MSEENQITDNQLNILPICDEKENWLVIDKTTIGIEETISDYTNDDIESAKFFISKGRKIYILIKNCKFLLNNYSTERLRTVIIQSFRNPIVRGQLQFKFIKTDKFISVHIQVSEKLLDYYCENYLTAPEYINLFPENTKFRSTIGNLKTSTLKSAANHSLDYTPKYLDQLTLKPYIHQFNNIEWMHSIECTANQNIISYKYKTGLFVTHLPKTYYQDLHSNVIYNEKTIDNYDEFNKTITLYGGVLCDEVGLGKTLSMIGLILAHPANVTVTVDSEKYISRATIIFAPARLCQQWEDEIKKYLTKDTIKKFKIYKITTITQLTKLNYELLCNAHIILVSYSFLSNKNYLNQDLKLTNIFWNRVILDEAHEVLVIYNTKKTERLTYSALFNLRSNYRWICTGDPLAKLDESFCGILMFLTSDSNNLLDNKSKIYRNLTEEISTEIADKYFRRNTKESTKNEITIPPITEHIVKLTFTDTERAVYNAASNYSARKMQLCTNILISEEDKKILGNRPVNMTEINQAMSEHFQNQAKQTKEDRQINKDNLDDLEKNYPIELADLGNRIQKLNDKNIPLTSFEKDELKILKENRIKLKASYKNKKQNYLDREKFLAEYFTEIQKQIKLFTELNINEILKNPCMICMQQYKKVKITPCGHFFCQDCLEVLYYNAQKTANCPFCRESVSIYDIKEATTHINSISNPILDRWGTKMNALITYLRKVFENPENRVIIFSQWNKMLFMVGSVLEESKIKHVYCRGNVWTISKSIAKFKRDPHVRVIMLSSETCSSGNNLTEATHVILLDTVNTSKENAIAIENQAIGRAFRLGQKKSVKVLRLIIEDTVEESSFNNNYPEKKSHIIPFDTLLKQS